MLGNQLLQESVRTYFTRGKLCATPKRDVCMRLFFGTAQEYIVFNMIGLVSSFIASIPLGHMIISKDHEFRKLNCQLHLSFGTSYCILVVCYSKKTLFDMMPRVP